MWTNNNAISEQVRQGVAPQLPNGYEVAVARRPGSQQAGLRVRELHALKTQRHLHPLPHRRRRACGGCMAMIMISGTVLCTQNTCTERFQNPKTGSVWPQQIECAIRLNRLSFNMQSAAGRATQ